MQDDIAFYINLTSDFLEGEVKPKAFERIFPFVFLRDDNLDAHHYKIFMNYLWKLRTMSQTTHLPKFRYTKGQRKLFDYYNDICLTPKRDKYELILPLVIFHTHSMAN
jgi:hypothetical protein